MNCTHSETVESLGGRQQTTIPGIGSQGTKHRRLAFLLSQLFQTVTGNVQLNGMSVISGADHKKHPVLEGEPIQQTSQRLISRTNGRRVAHAMADGIISPDEEDRLKEFENQMALMPVPKPIPKWDVHFEGLEDYRKDPNTTAADQ